MSYKKLILGSILSLIFIFVACSKALASEGQIEMRNTVQGQPHCYALSGYLPGEAQYNILVICRDLIYPVSPEALKYVVWTNPSSGNTPIRLGDLAFGKVTFKTKIPFTSVFVTQEKDTNVKTPTGQTVMRGTVRPVPFLDNGNQPAPSDEEEPTMSASPSPAPARSNILSFLRTGAVLTVIAIFVILLMLILVKPFK